MKKLTAVLFALTLSALSNLALSSVASAQTPPSREIAINITDAYIPAGFDSTSAAYVVVSTLFPNTCYKWTRAAVNHVSPTVHQVTSYAAVSQGMCGNVMIPLNHEVSLGQLVTGQHTIRFMNGDGTYMEKPLTVQ